MTRRLLIFRWMTLLILLSVAGIVWAAFIVLHQPIMGRELAAATMPQTGIGQGQDGATDDGKIVRHVIDDATSLPPAVQLKIAEDLKSKVGKKAYLEGYYSASEKATPFGIDQEVVRTIRAKYQSILDARLRGYLPPDKRFPGHRNAITLPGSAHQVLGKTTRNPVNQLIRETAEKVLDDGIVHLLNPGTNLKQFGEIAYSEGKHREYLTVSKPFLSKGLLTNPDFERLKDAERAKVIRALQLHSRSLARRGWPVADSVKAQAKGESVGTILNRVTKLQAINRKLLEHQYACAERTRKDVEDLKEIVYQGLPLPDDARLQLLDNDFVKRSASEKVKEKKELQFKSTVAKAHDYLDASNDLLTFAEKVGVKGNTMKAASDVIRVGNGLLNLASAVASKDPLKALAAIGSIFGGPDPDEERHRQVMEALVGMDQKISQVLENQKAIYQGVQELDRKITDLAREVHKNQEAVMAELGWIRKDVLKNREILNEQLDKDYRDIRAFLEIDRCKSYADKIVWFGEYYPLFQQARYVIGRNRVYDDFPKIGTRFQVLASDEVGPLFNCFIEQSGPAFKNQVNALLSPSATVHHLRDKYRRVSAPVVDTAFPFEQFSLFLNEMAVSQYTDYIIRFVPYIYLVDMRVSPPVLLSATDMRKLKNGRLLEMKRQEALRDLRDPIMLVNVALAQQALLSGDILLPALNKHLVEGTRSEEVLAILRHHPILARNLVMYFLHDRIEANRGNSLSYAFALDSRDEAYLKMLTRNGQKQFDFVSAKTRDFRNGKEAECQTWHLKLEGLCIPLPSVEDFRSGTLRPVPELVELYQLRERLMAEIASYELAETLSEAERKAMSALAFAP